MLVNDVLSTQLYIWLDVSVTWLSNFGEATFQVVQKTLGHQWILVQVYQVWRLHNNDGHPEQSVSVTNLIYITLQSSTNTSQMC